MEFKIPHNFPILMKVNVEKRVSYCFREIVLLPTFPLTKRDIFAIQFLRYKTKKAGLFRARLTFSKAWKEYQIIGHLSSIIGCRNKIISQKCGIIKW